MAEEGLALLDTPDQVDQAKFELIAERQQDGLSMNTLSQTEDPDIDKWKDYLKDWIRSLGQTEPIARWVSAGVEELDINFAGDIEIKVHRIGDFFLVVVNDPTDCSTIDDYFSWSDVVHHMERESRRGDWEWGWEFDIGHFNSLPDRLLEVQGPDGKPLDPAIAHAVLTYRDDEVREWLWEG